MLKFSKTNLKKSYLFDNTDADVVQHNYQSKKKVTFVYKK